MILRFRASPPMMLLITCAPLYKDDFSFFAYGVWYGGGKNRATIMSKSVTPTSQETDQMKRDMRQINEIGFSWIKFWVVSTHPERQSALSIRFVLLTRQVFSTVTARILKSDSDNGSKQSMDSCRN
jgi:hypothetical protein